MIDVILPVFNTPQEDLVKCFDSLHQQTFQDFHVIVVDDGSQYETATFLDAYCETYDNFSVFHKSNAGVSEARNYGVSVATQEFISFVDADDVVKENFFEIAMKSIKDDNLDIFISSLQIKNGNAVTECVSNYNYRVYHDEEREKVLSYALSQEYSTENAEFGNMLMARVYAKLIKRSLALEVDFNTSLTTSEDNLYCFDLFVQAKRIGVSSYIGYEYVIHPYSITNRKHSPKMINEQYEFAAEVFKRREQYKKYHVENAMYLRIYNVFFHIHQILKQIPLSKGIYLYTFEDDMRKEVFDTIDFEEYPNYPTKKKQMRVIWSNKVKWVIHMTGFRIFYPALYSALYPVKSLIKK